MAEASSKRRSRDKGLAGLALTLGVSLAAATLLIFIFAEDFPAAMKLFFLSPFGNKYYFGNMLAAAAPLLLGGLGISFAFSSKNFNLGGEGQVYAGALAATALCLGLPGGSPLWTQILAALAGAAAGGLIGSVSGILKKGLGVDELISSFLISAALTLGVDYLITGPLQDQSSNFQTTLPIAESLRFPRIFMPSQLSSALIVALALALLAKLVYDKTRFGYELRAFGGNSEFAAYCGMNTGLYTVLPMGLSGAFHGLAGAMMIMGTYYKAMKGFSSGVGWTAIAVALIARNNPLAVIPSAFFFAYLDAGAKSVMIGSNVSSEIVAVVQSCIFFLVTAQVAGRALPAKRKRNRPAAQATREGGSP